MVVGVAISTESESCAACQTNSLPGYHHTEPRDQCNIWPGYPRNQFNIWPGYPRDQCNIWPGYPRDQCNVWPGYPRQQSSNSWPGYVSDLGCVPEHAWGSLICYNKDNITHHTTGVNRTTLFAL